MDDLAYALEVMEDLRFEICEACKQLRAAGIALGAEGLLEEIEAETERLREACAEEDRRERRALSAMYERCAV